jgi:hypothetical protein
MFGVLSRRLVRRSPNEDGSSYQRLSSEAFSCEGCKDGSALALLNISPEISATGLTGVIHHNDWRTSPWIDLFLTNGTSAAFGHLASCRAARAMGHLGCPALLPGLWNLEANDNFEKTVFKNQSEKNEI